MALTKAETGRRKQIRWIKYLFIWKDLFKEKYSKCVDYFFLQNEPGEPLFVFRILFGILMILDVFEERGLDAADVTFGDTYHCFFPLFPWIQPVHVVHAVILYSFMLIGCFGITLGFYFRFSCLMYLIPYLYFFLLDKSTWNNHSYLFGLLAILLSVSDAGKYLSIDYLMKRKSEDLNRVVIKEKASKEIPRWNLFIFKFQFFILYFIAGLKKLMNSDWLNGYSMRNISKHQIFTPLKLILSDQSIDFYFIHYGGLIYDLAVGFLLIYNTRTRKLGIILSFLFHGLNAQLFDIGMFPYICLAALIIFCDGREFPLKFIDQIDTHKNIKKKNSKKEKPSHSKEIWPNKLIPNEPKKKGKNFKFFCLIFYMGLQIFLPFSHFISKGYNNWTPGIYGYSLDMMTNSYRNLQIKVTVKDLIKEDKKYLDPDVWVISERWTSHGDMAWQYARCIERNLKSVVNMTEIAVYFDVWKSMNGRFQQRVYDPRVDMLTAHWSPWEPISWTFPLLTEFSEWRTTFDKIIEETLGNGTTNTSNVVFVADFPGLYLENYLPSELKNVTIKLLSGEILISAEGMDNITLSMNGLQSAQIESGIFHFVHTISSTPSTYMYSYYNLTALKESEKVEREDQVNQENVKTHFCKEVFNKTQEFILKKLILFLTSFQSIYNAYLSLIFDIPFPVREE